MTGRRQKLPSTEQEAKPSRQEKKELDDLLDEALDETFPASDPPAMLEPAPDSDQSEKYAAG